MTTINQPPERGTRDAFDKNQQLRERVEMGRQADLILNNPAYQAAFAATRKAVVDTFYKLDAQDTKGMQLAHGMLRLCDKLQATMNGLVKGGEDANQQLDQRVKKIIDQERGESFAQRSLRAVRQR
jgi:hypothetical protein